MGHFARIGVILALTAAATGCQAPQSTQQLTQQNAQLQTQLREAQGTIAQLQARESALEADVAELNRVMGVLGNEKTSRVQESSQLRGLMRVFVQDQIDLLKDFLVKGDLLDYVGGELVARNGLGEAVEQQRLLVDLKNALPSEGVLTGVGGYFTQPGSFRVKVLRQIENNLVVVWESKLLPVASAGKQRVNFPVSVGVDAGDLVAYYFPGQVMVAVDAGTGDTRTYGEDLALGKTLSVRALDHAKQKRAYSLGVYGLLKTSAP
ncbi:hypothetical protein L1F30_06210 [Simiduia sp. 21SJ11W-1]|uniref:hypothetical protein n=1 Tax=Simiduia sp. 21SJ11W-1 TaxID=2909669 RepID=UPI00209EF9CF|nr:hypothetical protein [Simiduia sp. 21SJ11W-1]UTA49136.1 hypothetical protein L1F30_06210 [Simiduia sp. 21SJ11W-1]